MTFILWRLPSRNRERQNCYREKHTANQDVGYGRWVRGHGPRRGEDPETREAKRSRASQNPRAQNEVRLRQGPARSPPVWFKYLRGPIPVLFLFFFNSFNQIMRRGFPDILS